MTTFRRPAPIRIASVTILLLLVVSSVALAQDTGSINGTVKDQNGALVTGAEVTLLHPQQAVLRTTTTDSNGQFRFDNVPRGSYEIRISQPGFALRRVSLLLSAGNAELYPTLTVAPIADQTTVTADTGQAQEKDRVPQALNIISQRAIEQRTTAVLAQVADEEVGLALQRTSPTIAGIFVRGLVGNKVSVYIDGVRYTTSAMRGGINTFLDLNDHTNFRA